MPFLIILFIFLSSAFAVETACLPVVSITDGDTISVEISEGVNSKVRLLYIDTPESHSNRHGEAMSEGIEAAKELREMLPSGSKVRLWGPGNTLELDQFGRILAVVLLGESGWDSVQESMISAGYTVYWRKYGDAASSILHQRFLEAQERAKAGRRGAWGSSFRWMTDKSNERTAKQSKKSPALRSMLSSKENQISEIISDNVLPVKEVEDRDEFVMNPKSRVRHNSRCRYFKTKNTVKCEATDGHPCQQCGG